MKRNNRRISKIPSHIGGTEPVSLIIAEMGDQGDGIAYHHGQPVFAPYTLPHEHIKAAFHSPNRAALRKILHPSPDRTIPPCPYFTRCGGCQMQHWREEPYLAWKKTLVLKQLARHAPSLLEHLDLDIIPLPKSTRRRITFAIAREPAGLKLGFHKSHSHDIVDIAQCFVALPALNQAIPALREFFQAFLPSGKSISCLVTSADNGLDIHVTADWQLNEKQRLILGKTPLPPNVIRLTWQRKNHTPEPLILIDPPLLTIDRFKVDLPPGAFLQPSLEGEETLRHLVKEEAGKARSIADLYSGIGTFALPLAQHSKIYAADITAGAMQVLEKAARTSGLHGKIKTERRDLERSPLSIEELEDFDAVIFDPPRAGALSQCDILARSSVPKVIAISCSPASFAKDAKALIKGGYRLEKAVLLDQFSYSFHIEVFAAFRKH